MLAGQIDNRQPPLSSPSTFDSLLVEAQGWMVNSQGQIVLTPQPSTVTPSQPWQKPVTCSLNN